MDVRQRGFTLIEMLLSVSIIAIVSALSLPLYQVFQNKNDLAVVSESVGQALRRAQVYARAADDDAQWSVEIQSTAVTLFRGTNFVGRDASYDEAVSIPAGVNVTGLTEVQFAKMTGLPNTSGSITFTSARTGDVETVSINAKGMVQN
jgi:prepilin-type N-terminal cleavage/methylation domain-containing protein